MSRALAFGLFVWAAFDLPAWHLDRAGLAALGFGFLALSIGRRLPPVRSLVPTPQRADLPATTVDLGGELDGLLERLGAYSD